MSENAKWRPGKINGFYDKFYHVSLSGKVVQTSNAMVGAKFNAIIEAGNCYQTREEAETAAERVLRAYLGGV